MNFRASWIRAAGLCHACFTARWPNFILAAVMLACLPGCLTRTAAGPQLPYVQPANVVPQSDPASFQIASRMQEIEQELRRLRDQLERLQASGGDAAAIASLQERVSFIERQLGLEAQVQSTVPPAAPPPPGQPVPTAADQMFPEHGAAAATGPPPVPADNQMLSRGEAPTVPTYGRQQPPVDIRNNPLSPEESAYREAYAAFRSGALDRSAQLLEDFLKQHPKSEFAPSAVYWLGEARFAQGRFDEAVLQFDRVLKEFPGSKKELNSLLKQGESFEKMGETSSARVIYDRIISDYPHTAQARIAGGKLKSLPKE